MKKNKLINKILLTLCMSVMAFACSDDEGGGSTVAFTGVGSNVQEATGGTITLPLRDGSVSESDVTLGGTAVEGEDYTFDGVTDDGLEFTIINDDLLEANETIRVMIPSNENGTHTVTIVSNCEDTEEGYIKFFQGTWSALEDYGAGGTWGPYEVFFVQDGANPNRFDFHEFYDSGYGAHIIVDLENMTAYFPNQNATGDASSPAISASTGTITFDPCLGLMDINLTYDGGPWVYRFEKVTE